MLLLRMIGPIQITRRLGVRNLNAPLYVVAFFIAGGMAFFHGYEYLENNKLDDVDEFPAKYLQEHTVIICHHFVSAIISLHCLIENIIHCTRIIPLDR